MVVENMRENYQNGENINTSLVPESEEYSEIEPTIIKSMRASDYNNYRQFVNTDESLQLEDQDI